MMRTNIMIEFCLLGDEFNPEELTREFCLKPTEFYKKGSKSIRNRERKESCWSLSTGYIETLYLSELLDTLLEQLEKIKEKIVKLSQDLNLTCKFFVAVNIVDNEKPAIYLDNRSIEFANFVGAEFDFDFYIF